MRSYLELAGLLHCIYRQPSDKTVAPGKAVEQPDEGGPVSSQIPSEKEDRKALATLRLGCCEAGVLTIVKTAKTAKLAWEALKEAYSPGDNATQLRYISELLDNVRDKRTANLSERRIFYHPTKTILNYITTTLGNNNI